MKDEQPAGLSRHERLVLVVVGLVMVAVTVVVVGRLAGPRGGTIGPASGRPSPAPAVSLPISVVDAYWLAADWAHEWNPDAQLIMVSTQVDYVAVPDATTPVADGGMIIFSFAGPKSGDAWPRASVAVGRQTGTIFFDETTEYAVAPPAGIDARLLDLPIPAEQAFRIAEAVVGNAYRQDCEEYRGQVSVALDTTDPESTFWVVVYYDMRNRLRNDVVVRINAESGDLTSDVRHESPCSVASPAVVAHKTAV